MFLPPTVFSIFNAVLYASINPAVRRRLQRGLVGFGQSARDASAATSSVRWWVAMWISAMRSAEERLRHIPISSLVVKRHGHQQTAASTRRCMPLRAEVDAFLSQLAR